MTGREKIQRAFTPDGTPEIGAVICYEGIFVRDHWDQVTDQPWWIMQSPDLDAHVAYYRDRLDAIGQDWFSLPVGMPARQRWRTRIEERDDGVYRVDTLSGVPQKLTRPNVSGWRPGGGSHSVDPGRIPLTRADVDERIPVDQDFDWEHPLPEGCESLPERILSGPGRDCYPIGAVASPLWACYSLWGFEGLMRQVLDDPLLVEYAGLRWLQKIRQSLAAIKAAGAYGVWIEECFTDMVSPDAFRRLNAPLARDVVKAIRDAGMTSVYYYCGDPRDRWDQLLDIGADALALEEGKKGFAIDIDEVVDIVQGRCVVLGNLDAIGVLYRGSDEQLRAEIARQIEAGRRNGGRFIMSIGSPVTPETPLARVRQYVDLVHQLGS